MHEDSCGFCRLYLMTVAAANSLVSRKQCSVILEPETSIRGHSSKVWTCVPEIGMAGLDMTSCPGCKVPRDKARLSPCSCLFSPVGGIHKYPLGWLSKCDGSVKVVGGATSLRCEASGRRTSKAKATASEPVIDVRLVATRSRGCVK